MLTNEAVTAAFPLAQAVVAKNLSLTAVDPSPMNQLVNHTTGLFVSKDVGGQFAMSFSEGTEQVHSSASGMIVKSHDMIVDELVPELAKAVSNHISYAKNVVAPAVEQFVTQVDEVMRTIPRDETMSFSVVSWNPPQPLLHPTFETLLEKFQSVAINPAYRLPFVMGAVEPETLAARVKTGNSDLDISISVWLAGKGEKFLDTVYYSVFGNEYTDRIQNFIGQRASFSGSVTSKLDELLAIFLLSNGFIDNPPDGTPLTLSNYNMEMRTLNELAGAMLFNELKIIEANATTKPIVVRFIDRTAREIVVNKDVYDQFLEQGGDADAVLGSLLAKMPVFTLEEFLSKKGELSGLWNKHVAMASVSDNKYKFAKTKAAMHSVFGRMIAADQLDLEIPRALIFEKFSDELDRINERELVDPYGVALRLLGRSRYYRTDAEKLLSRIDALSKENPKLDPREVSTIAEIEYISDWCFDQMRLA